MQRDAVRPPGVPGDHVHGFALVPVDGGDGEAHGLPRPAGVCVEERPVDLEFHVVAGLRGSRLPRHRRPRALEETQVVALLDDVEKGDETDGHLGEVPPRRVVEANVRGALRLGARVDRDHHRVLCQQSARLVGEQTVVSNPHGDVQIAAGFPDRERIGDVGLGGGSGGYVALTVRVVGQGFPLTEVGVDRRRIAAWNSQCGDRQQGGDDIEVDGIGSGVRG